MAEEPKRAPFKKLLRVLVENRETIGWLGALAMLASVCYLSSRATYFQLESTAEELLGLVKSQTLSGFPETVLRHSTAGVLLEFQERTAYKELLFHLALALVVAIIIVLVVEIFSRRRTHRDVEEYKNAVASSVFSALCGRLVNDGIANELNGILKSDVVKENVRYTLRFYRPTSKFPDRLVVRRELSYRVRNVTGKTIRFLVRAMILNEFPDVSFRVGDGSTETVVLPRHIALKVDGRDVELSEREGTLKKNEVGQLRELSHGVDLPSQGSAQIFLAAEEMFPLQGTNTYMQLVPLVGLTITLDNRLENEVQVGDITMNHPRWKELSKGDDGVFEFPGGMIPGQSFTVMWGQPGEQEPKGVVTVASAALTGESGVA